MRDSQAAARSLGYEVITMEIRQAEDIAPAFETLGDRADAIYIVIDALVVTNRASINALALNARLPTMSGNRESIEAGGLISYGPNFPPPALFNEFFEVPPIGPFARTSNVRAPSSGGIGSSHGAAIIVSCASEKPCAHRVSIVGRSNS
jgi:hypothetical protein